MRARRFKASHHGLTALLKHLAKVFPTSRATPDVPRDSCQDGAFGDNPLGLLSLAISLRSFSLASVSSDFRLHAAVQLIVSVLDLLLGASSVP